MPNADKPAVPKTSKAAKPQENHRTLRSLLIVLAVCTPLILLAVGLLLWKNSRVTTKDGKSAPPVEVVKFENGFYNWEFGNGESWRWMQDDGKARLWNSGKDMMLRFNGRAPAEKAPQPPKVRLYLNGALLAEFDGINNRTTKTFQIPASKLGKEEWADLQITSTYVVVPAQVNPKSQDQRRLGYQFYTFEWLPTMP